MYSIFVLFFMLVNGPWIEWKAPAEYTTYHQQDKLAIYVYAHDFSGWQQGDKSRWWCSLIDSHGNYYYSMGYQDQDQSCSWLWTIPRDVDDGLYRIEASVKGVYSRSCVFRIERVGIRQSTWGGVKKTYSKP